MLISKLLEQKNLILRGDSGIGDDFDVSAGSESHESQNEMLFENEILTNKELLKKSSFLKSTLKYFVRVIIT